MADIKIRQIHVMAKKDQSKTEAVTETQLNSAYKSATVMEAFQENTDRDMFDFPSAMKILEKTAQQIKSGDLSRIEEMLISQAFALEVIFTKTVRTAIRQENLLQYEAHMRLGLKAQNQSRATLQALIQLKQPSQTAFIKQTNIAHGHQQVNNGVVQPSPEKFTKVPNELLEEKHGKWLDTGTKTKAKRVNTELEAVAEVHRGKNSKRKSKV